MGSYPSYRARERAGSVGFEFQVVDFDKALVSTYRAGAKYPHFFFAWPEANGGTVSNGS